MRGKEAQIMNNEQEEQVIDQRALNKILTAEVQALKDRVAYE